ncbi:hypothetical protein RJ639_040347 [Escallonia herrerae]|uniref:Pentatricopeptide repeat-containing protein n=1 Tax=Escallonia herrerae TaxID=1293975 RepID=A0AA89BBT5_9ASTE|nr:hypothetical protein RJ639_040347 [Escallonia herrerae]
MVSRAILLSITAADAAINTPPSLRTSSTLLPSLKPAEAGNLTPTTQFNQQVKVNPCLSSGNDHLTHGKLFSLLKSPPHLSEARRLHALLLVAGYFRPTATNISVLGSQLVNVYIRLGCLHHALLVFHHLPYKSNLSSNAILRGFVDAGHFSKAVELYHSMLRLGLVPDNYTYPLILKACSGLSALEEGRKVQDLVYFNEASRNLRPNAYVGCALIDMFAKCGSLDEARMVFDDMPDKDLASWTAMICGTAHNGEWLQALSLFSRMRSQLIEPDAVILAALLPSCGRLKAKPVGMALQGCAVRSGFENDLFLTNALMDMYCKCGDTSEAFFVFVNMVCKDLISWSTLIAGYSQNSQYRESLEIYLEMKRSGVKTNAVIAANKTRQAGTYSWLDHMKVGEDPAVEKPVSINAQLPISDQENLQVPLHHPVGSIRESKRDKKDKSRPETDAVTNRISTKSKIKLRIQLETGRVEVCFGLQTTSGDGTFWWKDLVETQGEFSCSGASLCFSIVEALTPLRYCRSPLEFPWVEIAYSSIGNAATSSPTFLGLALANESTTTPIEIFLDWLHGW